MLESLAVNGSRIAGRQPGDALPADFIIHPEEIATREGSPCQLAVVVRKRGFGHSGSSWVNELRANTPNRFNQSDRNVASRYKSGTARGGTRPQFRDSHIVRGSSTSASAQTATAGEGRRTATDRT